MNATPSKRNLFRSLAVTAGFNTLIALVLTAMVLGHNRFWDTLVISQCIGLSICAIVSPLLGQVSGRTTSYPFFKTSMGLLAGISLGSFLSWVWLTLLFQKVDTPYFIQHIFLLNFVFGIVFGIPIIYFFVSREKIVESERQIREEKIRRLTLEKEAAMMGIQLLQAQIEPHFLFNTLSNVISLMDMDPDLAKKMLVHLNQYLRISLARTRQATVTLDQELDLVRHYLDIFKIRMGDRLAYEIRNRADSGNIPLPPLILQPLVENAIKYGLEPKMEGGSICITADRSDDRLSLMVRDDGMGPDQSMDKAGIGINNVSQRLTALYGERAGLTLTENESGGITARVTVPL